MHCNDGARMISKWFAAAALGCALPAWAASESYRVDSDHTIPAFEVTHLGLTFVRGLFRKTSGHITLDRTAKTGDLEVVIDTATVTTNLERRDKLIRDWLKVEEFPTMVYRAKSLRFSGEDVVGADGELTLLGITKPVSLNVTHFICIVHPVNKRQICGADGTAQIKRVDFGLSALSNSVGLEVTVRFGIEAIKE